MLDPTLADKKDRSRKWIYVIIILISSMSYGSSMAIMLHY